MNLKKQFNKERQEILNLVPNRKELEKIILSKLKKNMLANKNKYFEFDDLLKIEEVYKHFKLFYCTADRNIGKTWDSRARIKKRYKKYGSSAIWMRRYDKEFKKLFSTESFDDEEWKLVKGEGVVYDKKTNKKVIHFLSLNNIEKSIEFPTATFIFFDEPNTEGRNIANAYDKLSHLITTIQRKKKNFLVILTANYVKQDDDILKKLGLGQKKADVQPLLVFNWVVGAILWNVPKNWYKVMSLEEKLNNLGYRSSLANFNTYKPQYGGTFNNSIQNHIVNIDEFIELKHECILIIDGSTYLITTIKIGDDIKLLVDNDDPEDNSIKKFCSESDYLLNPDYQIFPQQYINLLKKALINFNLVFLETNVLNDWIKFLNVDDDVIEESTFEIPIIE